jgi:hypothetical protein
LLKKMKRMVLGDQDEMNIGLLGGEDEMNVAC